MDPLKRHELHDNDLYEFLSNFGTWWSKYGTKVLVGLIVILGSITAVRLWSRSVDGARQTALTDLARATTPDSLLQLAQQGSDPGLRAQARLRAADLYLSKATLPEPTTAQLAMPESERQTALKQAEKIYAELAQDSQADKVYRLNAMLGHAAAIEGMGDLKTAGELYMKLKTEAGAAYPALEKQAQARHDYLVRLEKPVHFAPDPVTAPLPASNLPMNPSSSLPDLRSILSPTTAPATQPEPAPAARP